MEYNTLSLRQRKLLNLVQNNTSHITGAALAKQLGVSPRTIRSDIVEINQALAACAANIAAERSKGYYLECTDTTSFQELFKTDDLLLTREDRIRYLAFQLCLSEIPLDQYDLEDEMYISKTTLENDFSVLKKRYSLSDPHIKLIHNGDTWFFEQDEVKIRALLNQLFHNDWNYDTTGNAYYNYHFLDSEIMDKIMVLTSNALLNHMIQIEDANLVSLNLALAISYQRIRSGHQLPEAIILPYKVDAIGQFCDDIIRDMEDAFSILLPPAEKEAIYQLLQNSHLLDASKLNFETIPQYFDAAIINIADSYLERIQNIFSIDFSLDEDFYITLVQYIRYLNVSGHILNAQGNSNLLHRSLLMESEIAFLIQPIMETHLGFHLNETELLYLALCISGALEGYWITHPEQKINSVICCHLNLTAFWSIKRKVLGAFSNYMEVTALMPVNARHNYDFSDTALVLTTVKKEITDNPAVRIIQIKPEMTPRDYISIQNFIAESRLKFLFRSQTKTFSALLKDAFWHENLQITDRFSIIETLSRDLIDAELVTSRYTEDVLRRESLFTYGFQPGALFLYSLIPARKTQLSIATLKHRILWNSMKIRVIIMACFSPSEETLALKLLHEIYIDHDNLEYFRKERTKEELITFFS